MLKSKIKGIVKLGQSLREAKTGDSVSIILEDQMDISRGNLIVKDNELPLPITDTR